MLKCPKCGRVYEDNKQTYCLDDGAPLFDPNPVSVQTVEYSGSKDKQAFAGVAAAAPPVKSKSSFWIIAGVCALMVFLFIGVIVLVGVISFMGGGNSNKVVNTNTVNGNTQPTPVTLTATAEKYQPELKMAINGANNAQATAYASQDATALRNYYSGEALKAFTTDVDNLKRSKIYQISTMQAQDFEYFKVNDTANEAEVRVVETWETRVFQAANRKCLAYYPPTRTPQVVYLKKAASGWVIDSTVYDAGIRKDPQPCPKTK